MRRYLLYKPGSNKSRAPTVAPESGIGYWSVSSSRPFEGTEDRTKEGKGAPLWLWHCASLGLLRFFWMWCLV